MKKNQTAEKKSLDLKKVRQMVVDEQNKIRQEIADKMLTLATSAFGLVAALAWNDAIKGLFDHFFGSEREQLAAKIWYAIIITVLVVLTTYLLSRFLKKKKVK